MESFHYFRSFRAQVRVVIPAALYQNPQILSESRMCRSRRALALHYCCNSHEPRNTTKRNLASEYLHALIRRTVSHRFTLNKSSMTHLDHDHRKRENVCLLAVFILDQHLWRSPSHGAAILIRSAPYGIWAPGDLREAKIRDVCVAGVFYEDIRLVGYQCVVKQDSRRLRTPLRSLCITLQEWR